MPADRASSSKQVGIVLSPGTADAHDARPHVERMMPDSDGLDLHTPAFPLRRRVRLIGVSLSGLRARTSDHPEQLGFAL